MKSGKTSDKQLRRSGAAAENTAAAYLEGKGYHIIARNWRAERCEIDIIAREGENVVFAEVKSGGAIPPEVKVDGRKMENLARAAEAFIRNGGFEGCDFRFDLLAMRKEGGLWKINHIIDAFRP